MVSRLVHEENAMSCIVVSLEPFANVSLQRRVHKAKASSPIDAAEAGTQKDWSPSHISKMRDSIELTREPEDLNRFWYLDGGITAEIIKKLDSIDLHEKMTRNAKMIAEIAR
jgi:hypothetical protein